MIGGTKLTLADFFRYFDKQNYNYHYLFRYCIILPLRLVWLFVLGLYKQVYLHLIHINLYVTQLFQ